jgi:hypothetical protein
VADETPSVEQLLGSLTVEQLVVSAASTLASLAYAKLEAKDLSEARRAIDALGSLVPHVEGDLGRELQGALAGLQVAYATAASA